MNTTEIARILNDDNVPDDVEVIWRKHTLLCPFDDERCTHFEELLEALIDAWPDEQEIADKAFKDGQDEAEERLKEKHEEALSELQDKLVESGKEGRSVHAQTIALSGERHAVKLDMLRKLRVALDGSAKELRAAVHAMVVELIRDVNEEGPET